MTIARTALALCISVTVALSTAHAVDTTATSEAPELTAVRAKIKAKDFKSALADLNGMVDKGVQHADVYNLLGFSLRKTGDYTSALAFYKKALDYDADHKGAHESVHQRGRAPPPQGLWNLVRLSGNPLTCQSCDRLLLMGWPNRAQRPKPLLIGLGGISGSSAVAKSSARPRLLLRRVYPSAHHWRPIEITASSVRLPSTSQNLWKSGPSR